MHATEGRKGGGSVGGVFAASLGKSLPAERAGRTASVNRMHTIGGCDVVFVTAVSDQARGSIAVRGWIDIDVDVDADIDIDAHADVHV